MRSECVEFVVSSPALLFRDVRRANICLSNREQPSLSIAIDDAPVPTRAIDNLQLKLP